MSELSKIREVYSAKDKLGSERAARQKAENDRNSVLEGMNGVTTELRKVEGKLDGALTQVSLLEAIIKDVTNGKSQHDAAMAAMVSDMKDMVNTLCSTMQAMKPIPQKPANQVPFDVVIERNEVGRMTNLKINPRGYNG